jgi:2'-5' RNA ligase
MRAFVAIEVPPVTGSRPAHLTLRFLGEIEPQIVPRLGSALRAAVRDRAAFRLVLEGVGAFPSSDRPRVVWAGLTEGRQEVVDLADAVERALVEAEVPPADRPFSPHVTIFRVRGAHDLRRAREMLELEGSRRFGETEVREVILFESEPRPEGAVHRALERVPLMGPGQADA